MKKTKPIKNPNKSVLMQWCVITLVFALFCSMLIFRGMLIAGIITTAVFASLSLLLFCFYLKSPKTKDVKISTLSIAEAIKREGAFRYDKRQKNKVSYYFAIGALVWAAFMIISIIAVIIIGNAGAEKTADILLYCWFGYCGIGIIAMIVLAPYIGKKQVEHNKKKLHFDLCGKNDDTKNIFNDINNNKTVKLTTDGFSLSDTFSDKMNNLVIPYSVLKLAVEGEYGANKIPATAYITSNMDDGAYGLSHDILIELESSLYYWIKRFNIEVKDLEQLLECAKNV